MNELATIKLTSILVLPLNPLWELLMRHPALSVHSAAVSVTGSLSCYDSHLHPQTPAKATAKADHRQPAERLAEAQREVNRWQQLSAAPASVTSCGAQGGPDSVWIASPPTHISTKGRIQHKTQQPLEEDWLCLKLPWQADRLRVTSSHWIENSSLFKDLLRELFKATAFARSKAVIRALSRLVYFLIWVWLLHLWISWISKIK